MSSQDFLGLPIADLNSVEQNQADLQELFEIFISETAFVKDKASALLSAKSGDAVEQHGVLNDAQLQWERAAKQKDSLELDIEHVAKTRLQCRVMLHELDNKKAALEARCAAMEEELANLKNNKDKLIAETKQKWEKLVYACMHYKLRLSCHISLDKDDEHTFKFEFFQTQRNKETLYFIKLSYDNDGNWALLDMNPRLPQFDTLCKYLEKSQDIQRLVVYLHHKFSTLRDTLC